MESFEPGRVLQDLTTRRASLRTARRRARPAVSALSATTASKARTNSLRAVVRAPREKLQRRQQSGRNEDCEDCEIDQSSFGHVLTSFRKLGLEANVLQGVGGLAVQPSGRPIVTAARGEIALGDPR